MSSTPLPMHGKVCLLTGATSGIGLVTARELARQGARLIIVGRDANKTHRVVSEIRSQTGRQDVDCLIADLSSQEQIHELARLFEAQFNRLDVLINNAGGIWMRRQVTVDGLEMTLAVNHLAYFLLTKLLLETLKATPEARVVNVSSEAHRKAELDFNDLQGDAATAAGSSIVDRN